MAGSGIVVRLGISTRMQVVLLRFWMAVRCSCWTLVIGGLGAGGKSGPYTGCAN